jgi:hypothetical protein
VEPTGPAAAATASSPSASGPSRASRAAVEASTAWPPAVAARMATSDQGPSRAVRAGRSGRASTVATVSAAAAAARRWSTACRSVSSAWPRRRSTSMTWLATAVTLGSSRRAWKTRRARSCELTKRCTGSGVPGSQDRPAFTVALAIARSARGLVGL